MGWACPYQPVVVDTRISLVNIVSQKKCSFEAVNRIKLPYDINYCQKLMSKSLKLKEVSIYSQVNNTRGFYYFIKHDVAYL